jgi:sporulation protein YabP
MDRIKAPSPHRVTLEGRRTLQITGVLSVISFNETNVVAETDMGVVAVKGTELRVNGINLDSGSLGVDGMINSLSYHENFGGKTASFLGKIFK